MAISGSATALATLGAITGVVLLTRLTLHIIPYFRPCRLDKYKHNQPGSTWALVTGSSAGIGQGFAEELLSRGFNVLIHGRNEAKLATQVKDLSARFPALQVRHIVADAGHFHDVSSIDPIVEACKSLPGKLTVLINNIGGSPSPINRVRPQGTTSFNKIHEMSAFDIDEVLDLNVRFTIHLSRALVPLLISNGPSLVINIGSITGLAGMPWLSVYSGSKAFNIRFSEAMTVDLRDQGVEVLCLLVGNVMSAGNDSTPGFFTCTSRKMARQGLDRVGCGRSFVWGWWRHGLQFSLVDSLLPNWLRDNLTASRIAKMRQLELDQSTAT